MSLVTYGCRYAKKSGPTTEGTELYLGDWAEIFASKHDWDAHVWPYVRYVDGAPANPPLRVEVVNKEPTLPGEYKCGLIILDYDESNDIEEILVRLTSLPDGDYLKEYAVFHSTKSGCRIVYLPDSLIEIKDYGPIVRGISLDLFAKTGLKVDPSTDQWFRCFRLPLVMRQDDKYTGPTWEASYYLEPDIRERTVEVDKLPRQSNKLPWAVKGDASKPMAQDGVPDLDDEVAPSRLKVYKTALSRSKYKEYIFGGAEILPGRRDQTILAMAGEAVSRTYGIPDSTAEDLFLILKAAVIGIEPSGGESYHAKLWRIIKHAWNGEVKKQEERTNKAAVDRSQREIVHLRMSSSLPPEIVPNDPAEREIFLSRYYCLQTASGAYCVTETGEYTPTPLKISQIPAHFNDGIAYLSPSGFRNEKGRIYSGSEILNHHSINLDEVVYLPGKKKGARLAIVGERRELQIVPFSLRQDIYDHAEFDHEIDEWLSSFRHSTELKRWLGAALALHAGPIAACFLHGPARAGKSMLAIALAECFHGTPVPAAQAFSDYNGAILQSPVIMVDEGLPIRRTGMSTADLFRSLVTGSNVSTQRKFQDQCMTCIPYRIMFGANSYDMVSQLIGDRTLSAQDREALSERILVIDTGSGPTEYLDSRGSLQFTKESSRGSWIGGKSRLAKHIMRLYQIAHEEHRFAPDGRLLVRGSSHETFTLQFDLSGAGREVVDELTSFITKVATGKSTPAILQCLTILEGKVYIKKRPFCKLVAGANSNRADSLSIALARFSTGDTKINSLDRAVMVEIDVQKLIACGLAEGLDVSALRSLNKLRVGIV